MRSICSPPLPHSAQEWKGLEQIRSVAYSLSLEIKSEHPSRCNGTKSLQYYYGNTEESVARDGIGVTPMVSIAASSYKVCLTVQYITKLKTST